jgi:hypothetical protein
MTKSVYVKGFARRNPSQLFAKDCQDGYYFISRPVEPITKAYFDFIYSRLKSGERITEGITAATRGKEALLIPPYKFWESQTTKEKQGSLTGIVSNGTVVLDI